MTSSKTRPIGPTLPFSKTVRYRPIRYPFPVTVCQNFTFKVSYSEPLFLTNCFTPAKMCFSFLSYCCYQFIIIPVWEKLFVHQLTSILLRSRETIHLLQTLRQQEPVYSGSYRRQLQRMPRLIPVVSGILLLVRQFFQIDLRYIM